MEWMQERQLHLGASEARKLVPLTATGRPRKITDKDYLDILASKMVYISQDMCESTGAAARGHILEPFAVEAFNDAKIFNKKMYHWDDFMIYRSGVRSLSYSPDSLDIDQREFEKTTSGVSALADLLKPKLLVEVKSYSMNHHVLIGNSDKKLLEERWQIATAMFVSPSIEKAALVLFNPETSSDWKQSALMWHEYKRADLQDEMDELRKVERNWQTFVHDYKIPENHKVCKFKPGEIEEILEKRAKLNP